MSTQAQPQAQPKAQPDQNPEYVARVLQGRHQYLLQMRKERQQEIVAIEAELVICETELEARQCKPQ